MLISREDFGAGIFKTKMKQSYKRNFSRVFFLPEDEGKGIREEHSTGTKFNNNT